MRLTFIGCWLLCFLFICAKPLATELDGLLPGQWRGTVDNIQYRLGDNPKWAEKDVDLSQWKDFDRDKLINYQGIYWLRWNMQVQTHGKVIKASKIFYQTLGAFELYFDGELLITNGVPGETLDQEVPGIRQNHGIFPGHLATTGSHVLAFRFSSHHWHKRDPLYFPHNKLITKMSVDPYYEELGSRIDRQFALGFIGVTLFLALYYLILFVGNRRQRTHLLFSLLCAGMFCLGVSENLLWIMDVPYSWDYPRFVVLVLAVLLTVNLLPLVFMSQFNTPHKKIWMTLQWVFYIYCLVFVDRQVIGDWAILGAYGGVLLICLDALRRKQQYVWLSVVGVLACMIGYRIDNNYFYFAFSILSLLLLTGQTLQDRLQREQFHQSTLLSSRLEAELLRKNIQPHFLMNSLTTILEWVEVEPDKAGEFIELLADEFRLFNLISQAQLISLDEEIQLCRLHLNVMGFRLQKNFELELIDIDSERQLPPAVIHTLIENGISHNNYQQKKVTFVLRQSITDNVLTYTLLTPLADDGQTRQSYVGAGTGGKYIRSRLEQCFAGRWQLNAQQEGEHWVTQVSIKQV